MIHPAPRTAVLFAAVVPLTVVLVLWDEGLWATGLYLLAAAGVATAIDAVLALPGRAVVIDTDTPAVAGIGGPAALAVTLRTESGRPTARAEIVLEGSDLLGPQNTASVALSANRETRIDFPLRPRRRGILTLHRLWLRWRGPLGLVTVRRIEELRHDVSVVPNIAAVREAAVRFSLLGLGAGLKPQDQQGDGSEFDALRDYVPGLDRRTIDWKHSARHHKLVCKEFRAEKNHQIILAYDTGYLMREPLGDIPKLDHAVNAGLTLSYTGLRNGDRVGMFAFDSQVRSFHRPSGGLGHFAWLQRAAADLNYEQEETNYTLGLMNLSGRLQRRSLIILHTDFVDTTTAELMVENLGRLAGRHLVVFVTLRDADLDHVAQSAPASVRQTARAVVAQGILRERHVVLERLHRLGVHCIEAPYDQVGTALINRYLAIKQQDLI